MAKYGNFMISKSDLFPHCHCHSVYNGIKTSLWNKEVHVLVSTKSYFINQQKTHLMLDSVEITLHRYFMQCVESTCRHCKCHCPRSKSFYELPEFHFGDGSSYEGCGKLPLISLGTLPCIIYDRVEGNLVIMFCVFKEGIWMLIRCRLFWSVCHEIDGARLQ